MKDDKAGGCFPQGLQAALAEASKAGKPLLTMENLNKLAKNSEANKVLAQELIKDIPAFFRQRFYLTPAQDAFIKSMVKEKSSEIIKMAQVVAQNGGKVRFAEKIARAAQIPKITEEGKTAPTPAPATTTSTKEISASAKGGATGVEINFGYKRTMISS